MFAAFLGRPPDTATADDLRRFQLHQREQGVQPPRFNSAVSALRFFLGITRDRPDLARRLVMARQPQKLPTVRTPVAVQALLEAAPGPKAKAAMAVAYGAGLRVSEVVALKVSDIDSARMLLRVEQGKGQKDRHAMLSPQLLEILRGPCAVRKTAPATRYAHVATKTLHSVTSPLDRLGALTAEPLPPAGD